jgi:hypothetical protein
MEWWSTGGQEDWSNGVLVFESPGIFTAPILHYPNTPVLKNENISLSCRPQLFPLPARRKMLCLFDFSIVFNILTPLLTGSSF